MKNWIKKIIYIVFFALLTLNWGWSNKTTFTFKGISEAKGILFFIILKNEDAFKSNNPSLNDVLFRSSMDVISKEDIEFTISNLKPGKYAAKFYHDVNGNGVLDTNSLKIPKEPYGFSNNVKGIFGPPKYEDCVFEITKGDDRFTLKF